MAGRSLRSVEHFCPLDRYAEKGSLFACECGKLWHCRPYRSSPDYDGGEWVEVNAAQWAELTPSLDDVMPGETAALARLREHIEHPELLEPAPRRSVRQWWRHKFQLDRFPDAGRRR